jgi:hypothetical protein
MFPGAAEANTSAGAPSVIWVARVELAPKLNFTVSPGWAASNCLPIVVKVPVSDAAARTVIDPAASAELLAAGADVVAAGAEVVAAGAELVAAGAEVELLLLEQPATAIPASAIMVTAKRRITLLG